MTTGEKIAQLRKQNNHTQEQLAELLEVSRQAVSKWESNLAYPETEKLIRLSKLYGCSVDYLLHDEIEVDPMTPVPPPKPSYVRVYSSFPEIDKESRIRIGSLPLWHLCFCKGKVARGVFAAGYRSKGIFSFGLMSMGVVSFGVLSMGIVSLGILALGLLAAGSLAAGILAFGAVAAGVVAVGACCFGLFTVGAVGIAYYASYADLARAAVAAGVKETSDVYGSLAECSQGFNAEALSLLASMVPPWLNWAKNLFLFFIGL